MSIKISGILEDGVGNPIPNCTIELKAKKTTLRVIAKTEANILIDQLGSYSMNVNPGEYQVTLSVSGYPKNSVGDIRVYSDSTPGSLNDFLMLPGESDLTPELVLIFQQLRDESKLAAKAAEQSQLASETVQERAEEIQSDIAGKKAQIEATAEIVELQCSDAKTSAQAASGNADKTAQDLLATSALKDSAENAALRAQVSSRTSDESAIRAEAAADLVKTLSAEATTLTPSAEATAFWDANTNTLNLGVPQGIKGNTGPEGVQGIQGIQGEQGVKGDKGDVGAQAQLSPLLTAISALDTAADQIIYLTDKDSSATTALTELGRKLIAVTTAETARAEIGAAADSDALKIENNLSEISTAAAKTASRGNLGLGSASIKDVGTATGQVMEVGAFNVGDYINDYEISAAKKKIFFATFGQAPDGWPLAFLTGISFYRGGITARPVSQIGLFDGATGGMYYRGCTGDGLSPGPVFTVRDTSNTWVDANGYIRQASPVIKLFRNGNCECNHEAVGIKTTRISEGIYRLSGSVMGFNSDRAWHIEIPRDENKQPLIWVDYEVEANGDTIVKTYHRIHLNAPRFAQNVIDGYSDGDPIDIPAGRWIDLRVQVYSDGQEIVPVTKDS
ncbi:phage tail fiber protein [Budvicia aquatica]|uniref:phage tail fiber protein n=1 Tax=Budvicia aquatica TaxID=82979 RepID=UPI00207F61E7|nr:prophage tail fiber N-terminal domain-containing protein [Budvicia aquatica]GKX50060.1 hypothetical protein SOASR029_03690 [Budvicia aquatica]